MRRKAVDLATFLFSFRGRVNRLKFWTGTLGRLRGSLVMKQGIVWTRLAYPWNLLLFLRGFSRGCLAARAGSAALARHRHLGAMAASNPGRMVSRHFCAFAVAAKYGRDDDRDAPPYSLATSGLPAGGERLRLR